jgi:hypothetical protein
MVALKVELWVGLLAETSVDKMVVLRGMSSAELWVEPMVGRWAEQRGRILVGKKVDQMA